MTESSGVETNSQVRATLGLLAVVGLLVLLGLLSRPMLVVTLVIVFVVFAHELGHFITARMTGMKATEVFIGVGPRYSAFEGVKQSLASSRYSWAPTSNWLE